MLRASPERMPRRVSAVLPIRLAAWTVTILLVALSVVPPNLRPQTILPHNLEHFASFVLVGILWSVGYPRRLLLWLSAAVAFAASLELLQLVMPGRHARLIDFLMDAIGACVGVLVGFIVLRWPTAGRRS